MEIGQVSESFVVVAETRTEQGTGASRRLRRAGRLPAIVYGGHQAPEMVSLDHNELWKALKHESFYSQILTMQVGDRSEKVVLKALHRHPLKDLVLHADLMRIESDVAIRMRVPLHFLGQDVCPGVKTGGGLVDHLHNEIEVECLPGNLPEFIEVDVSALNVGDSVHLSDLKLPEGVVSVELKHGNDEAILTVQAPRVSAADEEEAPDAE